jgi:hypothetical protein
VQGLFARERGGLSRGGFEGEFSNLYSGLITYLSIHEMNERLDVAIFRSGSKPGKFYPAKKVFSPDA